MGEWQDIKTAPRDGTRILVLSGELRPVVVRMLRGRWTVYSIADVGWFSWVRGPLHWLVLREEPSLWTTIPIFKAEASPNA